MMIVNPLTAWALIEIAKKGGHKAVAQTAAAGALGCMILRLARRRGLPVVHVVRRQEQAALLRSLGAEHVLDSSDPEFDGRLKELCHRLQVSLAFDAVAGEMTGRLLQALVPRGRVLVYGGLSLQACQLHPGALIFEGKRVEGFWLADWLRHKNILSRMRMATQVQKLLASDLRSDIRARLPLEHAVQGIQQYAAQMTGGKILITPDRSLS
jgi:NADPH:quinone reductase-like Zn-dependent oxidoreductase